MGVPWRTPGYRSSALDEKQEPRTPESASQEAHVPTRGPLAAMASWLPLDRAALGLGLRRVGLLSGQHRVERGAKPGRVLRWIVVVGIRSASVAQLQT